MTRTIQVAAPAGLSSPVVDLVTDADAVQESVVLVEDGNSLGKYRGVLTAPGGTYTAVIKTGVAETPIGTFLEIVVSGVDPEVVLVGDVSVPQHVQRLGQNVTRTHRTSGDTLPEVVNDG